MSVAPNRSWCSPGSGARRPALDHGRRAHRDALGRPPTGDRSDNRDGYVCSLRSALGTDALATAGPAYRLTVPISSVDAHRFCALVDQARNAHAAARLDDAWEILSSALALWRGPALADLGAGLFVAEESRRLTELHLAAIEQQMQIGLDLERHDVLLPELEELVGMQIPLRERLWTVWMTALYRSGRQAEALAAYRRLRALLVEELGIEPWETVTDLHQRMLAHDTALVRRPHDGAVPAPARPGNLPHRLTSFVGRRHATREPTTCCAAGARVVTLVGAGGVGKSRLAEQAAAQVASRFRHGVWLAELAPLSRGVPHAIAAALGIQQRHGLGIVETVVAYCQRKQLLLVVDNCEHLRDDVGGLVERMVSSTEEVRVLATSREALGVPGEQIWPVPPLGAPDARALFAERAIAVRPGLPVGRRQRGRRGRGLLQVGRRACSPSSLPPPGCEVMTVTRLVADPRRHASGCWRHEHRRGPGTMRAGGGDRLVP